MLNKKDRGEYNRMVPRKHGERDAHTEREESAFYILRNLKTEG